MAKQETKSSTPQLPQSDTLESRAWELYRASTVIGSTPTMEPDHMARECFKKAAVFESVAAEQKELKG